MTKTVTFVDRTGDFRITMKEEVLTVVSDPSTFTFVEMLVTHKTDNLLHNEEGPAIYVMRNGHTEYWLNGSKATAEQEQEIKEREKNEETDSKANG